jgi:MFS transporter, OPA family, solute carrier family 37 (glycerol-3-phosphate transporter), member 1/2
VTLKQDWAHLYLFAARRPNDMITSAVAGDLAAYPSIRGNNKSHETVGDLINGAGSIIASIGLLAVGPLEANHGFASVWTYLIFCTAIGTLLMSTKIYAEVFPPSSARDGIQLLLV